jgi:ABC-2 type transport system permease protein
MRALVLAGKDLSQTLRDWRSTLFLLLMPLAFTLFFGLVAFGSGQVQPTKLGWADKDSGPLGPELHRLLLSSPGLLLADQSDEAAVTETVRAGRAAAAVIVPAGFSAAALDGAAVPLTVVADPGSPGGRIAIEAVRTAAGRVLGSATAARLSLEAAAPSSAALRTDPAARAAFLAQGLRRAGEAWGSPRVTVGMQAAGSVRPASGFTQASPGMLVQFAIFGLITSAMILMTERKSRTLRRLLSTPISPASIIGGHVLAMFLIVLLQEAILVACGQFLFGVRYLAAPAGTLLMMVAVAAWAASLGLLIGALARKEQQVVAYSLAAMFIFSALGGAWFPLDVAGKGFAQVGGLLPTAWAMTGFQNIVLRGLGAGSTLVPAGIIFAWAAAFFAVATWRFRFE